MEEEEVTMATTSTEEDNDKVWSIVVGVVICN